MPQIAWGRKVSTAFKNKLLRIAGALDCDPNHLMAAMAFETTERFTPDVRNRMSGATGLIQFMPKTAKDLGTTTAKLAEMTAVKQLDYVKKYLKPFKGKMRTLSDVYMTILWPAAVGKLESYVLFRKPSQTYNQNSGLDINKDGVITKAEAASKVHGKLIKGMGSNFLG